MSDGHGYIRASEHCRSLRCLVRQVYARREEMNKVIAAATAGLPASAQKLVKHIEAKARSMPSLAAMKTTKLQDADCANKDVYEMILGKFTGLASNLTRDKVFDVFYERRLGACSFGLHGGKPPCRRRLVRRLGEGIGLRVMRGRGQRGAEAQSLGVCLPR